MFKTTSSAIGPTRVSKDSAQAAHAPSLLSRLVEEVKELCDGLELENEDVYMATMFGDFIQLLVRKLRGEDEEGECVIDYVSLGPLWMGMASVDPQ